MAVAPICVGICKFHKSYKICMGCYRSALEIREWLKASDERKEEIVESCERKKNIYGDIRCPS